MYTELKTILNSSKNIVFFGGAGVSTESGIPDFRSQDGLYSQKYKYPPETILSHSFFKKNAKDFYDFYRDKMIFLDAQPNAAHLALARLEAEGSLKAVITQNIDGLHSRAGSQTVIELHGSVHRNYCMNCGSFYGIEAILHSKGVPLCHCGGIIKPDVVLYEEGLDPDTMEKALHFLSQADGLIVGGTSLQVYPAAGLVSYYQGNKLILINKSETPYDKQADLIIHDSIGAVFSELF